MAMVRHTAERFDLRPLGATLPGLWIAAKLLAKPPDFLRLVGFAPFDRADGSLPHTREIIADVRSDNTILFHLPRLLAQGNQQPFLTTTFETPHPRQWREDLNREQALALLVAHAPPAFYGSLEALALDASCVVCPLAVFEFDDGVGTYESLG